MSTTFNYEIRESAGGWKLTLFVDNVANCQNLKRVKYFKKYIEALRVVQQLQLHLKPNDRLIAC